MAQLEEKLNLYDFSPDLIFNFDETMLDASEHKVKVLVCSRDSKPFTENEAKLRHMSLGLCISTASTFLYLLLILLLKNLPLLLSKIEQFFCFSGQDNGFINNKIQYDWVKTVLISYIQKIHQQLSKLNQKALFLVDSHSTYKHELTILFFKEHNIIVIIFPAHSSTILQPLDLTVNREFKRLLRICFKPKKMSLLSLSIIDFYLPQYSAFKELFWLCTSLIGLPKLASIYFV